MVFSTTSPSTALICMLSLVAIVIFCPLELFGKLGNVEFDKPFATQTVRARRVDLGNRPIVLTCFYYPGLLIKQGAPAGESGASWLSITRFKGSNPRCQYKPQGKEFVIFDQRRNKAFAGSVAGVKDHFVILESSLPQSGGLQRFAIYNSNTNEKILDDVQLEKSLKLQKLNQKIQLDYRKATEVVCPVFDHVRSSICENIFQSQLKTAFPETFCRNSFQTSFEKHFEAECAKPTPPETMKCLREKTKILDIKFYDERAPFRVTANVQIKNLEAASTEIKSEITRCGP